MRAALVRELKAKRDELVATKGVGAQETLQATVAHHFLRHISRSPQRTGARKNELFQALARGLVDVAAE